MANLNYKVTNIKFEPKDDSVLVFIDISSDVAPDCLANAALDYTFSVQDLQLDVDYADPISVPYGDTYVLYDDGGFSLDNVDASNAIEFCEYYICDADNDIWGPEEFEAAEREVTKLLNCTEEELKAFFDVSEARPEYVNRYGNICEAFYCLNNDYVVAIIMSITDAPTEIVKEIDN